MPKVKTTPLRKNVRAHRHSWENQEETCFSQPHPDKEEQKRKRNLDHTALVQDANLKQVRELLSLR